MHTARMADDQDEQTEGSAAAGADELEQRRGIMPHQPPDFQFLRPFRALPLLSQRVRELGM